MLKIDAANIIITVINLLVLFVAMKLVFFKPLAKIIGQRQEEADKQLADAKAKQEEAKQIKITAEQEAEKEKTKIMKSAEKDIADMVVDAATKVVGTQSGANIDSSLYNEFLGKAGD